jgi:hypothetical protein
MSKMITEIIDNEPYEYIPLGNYVVKAKRLSVNNYCKFE